MLIFILAAFSCNVTPCEIGEKQILIAINALHSKDILDFENSKLYINFSKEFNLSSIIGREFVFGGKKVLLEKDMEKLPQLTFINITSKEDLPSRKSINFIAKIEGGYTYSGEIIFECQENKMTYMAIDYFSSIE